MKEIALTIRRHTLRQYRRNFTKAEWKTKKACLNSDIKYVFTCEDERGNIGWVVGVKTKQDEFRLFCFGRLCAKMTAAEMVASLAENF